MSTPDMPAELATRFAEVRESLERAHAEYADANANGADMDADMAALRTALRSNPTIRRTLFYIGDRYAVLTDPARLLRAHYHEESLWTEPPMWYPGAPIYGFEDELLGSPGSTHSWADSMPLASKPALVRLEQVLAGLDMVPEAQRVKLVAAWRLLDHGADAYMARTDIRKVPQKAEYAFSSLLLHGPLTEAEAGLLGGLLRAYCNVAHTRRRGNEDHPYIALRRHHDVAHVSRCVSRISHWEEKQKDLEAEWRTLQRTLRIERKQRILASGLAFQDELAAILEHHGYLCQPLPRKDRGIDLLTHKNGGISIGIQAKKHARPIGADKVRELRGAREIRRLDIVAMVSASGFTRDARVEARIQPAVSLVSLEDLLERIDLGQDPLFPKRQGFPDG